MELEILELITRIPLTVSLSLIETSLLYLEVALFSICRFLTCFSVLPYQKRSFTLNLFFFLTITAVFKIQLCLYIIPKGLIIMYVL